MAALTVTACVGPAVLFAPWLTDTPAPIDASVSVMTIGTLPESASAASPAIAPAAVAVREACASVASTITP